MVDTVVLSVWAWTWVLVESQRRASRYGSLPVLVYTRLSVAFNNEDALTSRVGSANVLFVVSNNYTTGLTNAARTE